MHLADHIRTLRRAAPALALSAILAVVALSLVQCQMVEDTLTGVSLAKSSAGSCVAACSKTANDALRAESDLHLANVKACGDDQSCLDQEEARHEAAVNAIQAERVRCQDECHHQGGGEAGR